MSTSADSFFQRIWYDGKLQWLSLLLLPLSWLFGLMSACRRAAYHRGVSRQVRLTRPVVVIGNITVGGTGKTPFTIWLAGQLQARGHRVGIILRGYGGRSGRWPRDVDAQSDWEEVGDEAVLYARRTTAVVVAGPDRVADAQRAIERGADIILSDDGLQHYRLARAIEIAVVDARRGLGNARLLPAGPLREPPARLDEVDLRVVMQRGPSATDLELRGTVVHARPVLRDAVCLATGEVRQLREFSGTQVHAIAGIGHPAAFFGALEALGIHVHGHPMPDHARLTPADLRLPGDAPVLMTEKDAVRCRAIGDLRHWYVRMDITVSEHDTAAVLAMFERSIRA